MYASSCLYSILLSLLLFHATLKCIASLSVPTNFVMKQQQQQQQQHRVRQQQQQQQTHKHRHRYCHCHWRFVLYGSWSQQPEIQAGNVEDVVSTITTPPTTIIAAATGNDPSPTTSTKRSSNNSSTNDSRRLIFDGMESFRNGNVEESIIFFNEAEQVASPVGSLTPYLWQRGISYYYMNQFNDASQQFRIDVNVNPTDVEEIVWDIASLVRIQPDVFPPKNMMSLPSGVQDRRKIMSTVYKLFRGECNEHDLAIAGHAGNKAEEFYSLFYLGLYCEIRNENSKAIQYMKRAIQTEYATTIGRGDYMTSVARVHCKRRGWI